MKQGIAVMGGFGGGNLGDELIGLAEAGLLKASGIEPIMYTFSPVVSAGIQPEIKWVDYRDLPDYFQRIRNLVRRYSPGEERQLPGLVVIGAGGLLYDRPITHLIGWHSRTLYLRRKGVPYVLFANSLRRPHSRLASFLLRDLLGHASSVSLRDQLSLDIANELCPRDDYFLASDPVLALGKEMASGRSIPSVRGRVAVVPRPWSLLGADGGLSFWRQLLEKLMAEQGIDPVLVAFDPRMDIQFCEKLKVSLGLEDVRSWDPACGLASAGSVFDGCEMVFGMRFHALILALLLEKPMLAFSYDEKVRGLMADLGLSSLCVELDGDVSAALDFVTRGRAYLEEQEAMVLDRMREYVSESSSLMEKDFVRILNSVQPG